VVARRSFVLASFESHGTGDDGCAGWGNASPERILYYRFGLTNTATLMGVNYHF
jgi:hypothetical protein